MALHIVTGLMNEGKTLVITYFGIIAWLNNRTIYTNYDLSFPHIKVNWDFMLKLGKEQPSLENSCFLLDETWINNDSRTSISENNRLMSYFFLQSSKDDGEIYLTCQRFSQNDKRVKENFHYWHLCERYLKIGGQFHKIITSQRILPKEMQPFIYIKVTNYFNGDYDLKKVGEIYINASMIFDMYNTKQKISRG